MKVYSHFSKLNNSEGLRWGTILQFGDSWAVIGSVVMKNPGSSACGNEVHDSSILENLQSFQSPDKVWYEFTIDDTMRKVAKLFRYKEGTKNTDSLNGVIRIFNLFYYREADLGKALLQKAEYEMPEEIISDEINLLQPPVYLGFGDLAFDKNFTVRARAFYDKAINLGMECYLPDFEANTFRHPQYLMGFGKNQKASIEMLAKFKANNSAPNDDEIKAAAAFMQSESLSISEWNELFCHLCQWMIENLSFQKTETNPKNAGIPQSTWIRFHFTQSCSFQIVRQKGNNQFVRFDLNGCPEEICNYLKKAGYTHEANSNSPRLYRKDRIAFNSNIYYALLEIYDELTEVKRLINKFIK